MILREFFEKKKNKKNVNDTETVEIWCILVASHNVIFDGIPLDCLVEKRNETRTMNMMKQKAISTQSEQKSKSIFIFHFLVKQDEHINSIKRKRSAIHAFIPLMWIMAFVNFHACSVSYVQNTT